MKPDPLFLDIVKQISDIDHAIDCITAMNAILSAGPGVSLKSSRQIVLSALEDSCVIRICRTLDNWIGDNRSFWYIHQQLVNEQDFQCVFTDSYILMLKEISQRFRPYRNKILCHTDKVCIDDPWPMWERAELYDFDKLKIEMLEFRRRLICLFESRTKNHFPIINYDPSDILRLS